MTELTVFKLTPLGLFHTFVSIVCVFAALVALARDRGISPRTSIGRSYLITLWITTLTGFPIFRNGAPGPPHVVGVLTVLVLGIAALAGRARTFGGASARVEALAYSTTVLLLMIPTVTETLTRVPPGRPFVASPESPVLLALYGVLLVLFGVGASAQWRRTRPARA